MSRRWRVWPGHWAHHGRIIRHPRSVLRIHDIVTNEHLMLHNPEITSRDHSATSTFIHSRRLFQGPGLPPSNAIQSDFVPSSAEPPLPAHHHPARRGLTTFFFRFPLPSSSPASISFGPAQIRYEVRASVGVAWRGEKRLVTDQRDLNVVECYDSRALPERPQGVAIAEGGNIWAQASVTNGPIIAGEIACVDLQLKNHSLKWVCCAVRLLCILHQLSTPGRRPE
jgi:hypothetical protein